MAKNHGPDAGNCPQTLCGNPGVNQKHRLASIAALDKSTVSEVNINSTYLATVLGKGSPVSFSKYPKCLTLQTLKLCQAKKT